MKQILNIELIEWKNTPPNQSTLFLPPLSPHLLQHHCQMLFQGTNVLKTTLWEILAELGISTSRFLYQDNKAYRDKWSNLLCAAHAGPGPGSAWLLWDAHSAIVGWPPDPSISGTIPGNASAQEKLEQLVTPPHCLLCNTQVGLVTSQEYFYNKNGYSSSPYGWMRLAVGRSIPGDWDVLPAPLSMYISWLSKKHVIGGLPIKCGLELLRAELILQIPRTSS